MDSAIVIWKKLNRRKEENYMVQYKEEMQEVVEWLEHPNELGKAPAKIEFTKEFTDSDGIHCLIFRFKKGMLSPWLLAIHSESGIFRMLSGNPRLFNCRDESAKRFSGEFEKQEDIECVFDIFLLFLYVYGILCV